MSNIIFALTLSPSFVNSTLLLTVGIAVGSAVGVAVGVAVGSAVGVAVGSTVGLTVGVAVGSTVGVAVAVGVAVGSTVGVAVGVTTPTISLKLRSTFPFAVGAVTVTSYTPSAISSMNPIVDEYFETLILPVIGAKHILSFLKSAS